MSAPSVSKLDELISLLDRAVEAPDCDSCCENVKNVLHDVVISGEDFVPAEFLRTADGRYARRLLHRHPSEKYALMVMVWDEGQGTALHDHAGKWCVECVYRGTIKVVSYSIQGNDTDVPVQFNKEEEVLAGVGEAGKLIPPFDYHTIENACSGPAVTLHVYGGEMDWCHAFVPIDGGYRRERRELSYTD